MNFPSSFNRLESGSLQSHGCVCVCVCVASDYMMVATIIRIYSRIAGATLIVVTTRHNRKDVNDNDSTAAALTTIGDEILDSELH